MTTEDFQALLDKHSAEIEEIRLAAHKLHDHVNQSYDKVHPYGIHLDMVADSLFRYGHEVCAQECDVLPLFFGAFFHDSIEDARQTYNSVMAIARQFMDDDQAYLATEIVYALTNEKGRTRAERASEKYYQGIRDTAYAPFVKLADRLANISYSYSHNNRPNARMKSVYKSELPHFLASIKVEGSTDSRFSLPEEMLHEIVRMAGE